MSNDDLKKIGEAGKLASKAAEKMRAVVASFHLLLIPLKIVTDSVRICQEYDLKVMKLNKKLKNSGSSPE